MSASWWFDYSWDRPWEWVELSELTGEETVEMDMLIVS